MIEVTVARSPAIWRPMSPYTFVDATTSSVTGTLPDELGVDVDVDDVDELPDEPHPASVAAAAIATRALAPLTRPDTILHHLVHDHP